MKLPLAKAVICCSIAVLLIGASAQSLDECSAQNSSHVYCEKDIVENELDEKAQEEIIQAFNNNIQHSVEILAATEMDIILSNDSNILTLANDGNMFRVKNFLDLNELVDGNINSNREIILSPDNRYLIFANLNEEINQKSFYYHDLENNKLVTVETDKIMDIVDDWSSNSLYYAYGNKEGENVSLFDVKNKTTTRIAFKKEKIKEIYVTDNGSIYVKGNKKYYLDKNSNFTINEVLITGTLLGCIEEKLIYYSGGDIYFYEKGKIEKAVEVGKEFNLVNNDCNRAIFSNENETVVYDYKENSLNKYAFKYEQINYILFNNSSEKCLIDSDRFNAKVIGSNGQYFRIENNVMLDYIGKCKWLDCNSLIRIDLDNGNRDFKIIRLNVQNSKMDMIFKRTEI